MLMMSLVVTSFVQKYMLTLSDIYIPHEQFILSRLDMYILTWLFNVNTNGTYLSIFTNI